MFFFLALLFTLLSLLSTDESSYPLPSWFADLPRTLLRIDPDDGLSRSSKKQPGSGIEGLNGSPPPTYPVVAMGGTFDHLHSGHKILLSMAAWIARDTLIVGVTGAHAAPFSSA